MSNRRIYSSQALTPHIQVQHSPVSNIPHDTKIWRIALTRWPGQQHTAWHRTVEAAWKEAAGIIGEALYFVDF